MFTTPAPEAPNDIWFGSSSLRVNRDVGYDEASNAPDIRRMVETEDRPVVVLGRASGGIGAQYCSRAAEDALCALDVLQALFGVDVPRPAAGAVTDALYNSPNVVSTDIGTGRHVVTRRALVRLGSSNFVLCLSVGSASRVIAGGRPASWASDVVRAIAPNIAGLVATRLDRIGRDPWVVGEVLATLSDVDERYGTVCAGDSSGRWDLSAASRMLMVHRAAADLEAETLARRLKRVRVSTRAGGRGDVGAVPG